MWVQAVLVKQRDPFIYTHSFNRGHQSRMVDNGWMVSVLERNLRWSDEFQSKSSALLCLVLALPPWISWVLTISWSWNLICKTLWHYIPNNYLVNANKIMMQARQISNDQKLDSIDTYYVAPGFISFTVGALSRAKDWSPIWKTSGNLHCVSTLPLGTLGLCVPVRTLYYNGTAERQKYISERYASTGLLWWRKGKNSIMLIS